jgi:hypothetical protein
VIVLLHINLSIVKSLVPWFKKQEQVNRYWHAIVIKGLRPHSNYGITYHLLEHKKTLRFATRYICVLRSIFTTNTVYFSSNNLTIGLDRN